MPSARDYMSKSLTVLSPEEDVVRAMQILVDAGISGAPVVDAHGNLKGLLSQRDCLTAAFRTSYHGETAGHVADYMTREIETVPADMPLIELIRDGLERRVLAPLGMRLVVDPKALIEKPDPTATVLRLLQLGVIDPVYAFEMLGYDPSRAREIPQRAYSTQQMEAIPAEFSVGGERGGGQTPEIGG